METMRPAERAVGGGPEDAAAANRRNGAHAVLAAASALVGLPAAYSKVRALVLLLLLLLGCTTVHISLGGRRRRREAVSTAPARIDRPRARLRWTGFHTLLFLGGFRLLVDPNWPAAAAAATAPRVQLLGAYTLFMLGGALVLLSTFHNDVPRAVRPAAAAAARGLDGLLFGGRFAASHVD